MISVYFKEDAGKLLIGIFEGKSIPAFDKTNTVPENFSFGEFPENFEHFEPYLEKSMKRFPILEKVGIRKFLQDPNRLHQTQILYWEKFLRLKTYL